MTDPIRLVLDADQTASIIEQAGGERHEGRVFACMAPGSFPDAAGRLVLYLIPAESVEAVDGAVRVARGQSKERRPRKAKVEPA